MQIQNRPAAPTSPVDPVQAREQEAARRAAAAYGRAPAGARTAPAAGPAAPQDRVTISEEGRALLAAEAERNAALAAGQEALDALPEMTEERAAELRARVESGHYAQPEQTRALAEKLAAALRGEDPDAGA